MPSLDWQNTLCHNKKMLKNYLILIEQGDIEQTEGACLHKMFTDTLLLRYKASRSYDLYASGNIHSFEYNSLKEQSSVCL